MKCIRQMCATGLYCRCHVLIQLVSWDTKVTENIIRTSLPTARRSLLTAPLKTLLIFNVEGGSHLRDCRFNFRSSSLSLGVPFSLGSQSNASSGIQVCSTWCHIWNSFSDPSDLLIKKNYKFNVSLTVHHELAIQNYQRDALNIIYSSNIITFL